MVNCAVVDCNNTNDKNRKNYKNISFFCFPKEKDILNEWVFKCFRQNKFNVKTARICADHFCRNDYELKGELLMLPRNKWSLKKDAVPSLKLPKSKRRFTETCTETETERDIRLKKRRIVKSMKDYSNEASCSTMTSIKVEFDELNDFGENNPNRHQLKQTISTQTEGPFDELIPAEHLRAVEKERNELKLIVEKQQKELQALKQSFTKGQIQKLTTGKDVQWTIEDISAAISLHAAGPRSYHLLRKRGHPLPGVSTLRRWSAKMELKPGNI